MNRLLLSLFWIVLTLVSLPSLSAQESNWPRTVPLEQGMVTIYPLQVDEMSGSIIHFRAALAYRATAGSEPVFGAGWFESPVEIDSASRIVHPTDLIVTETRFPAGTEDVKSGLSRALAVQSPDWNLDFSLDELDAALKMAQAESEAAQSLNTAPPRIIYRDHPALLISMDGEPVLREIENSSYKAVINTPYPLIFNGKHYYLNAARDVWYRASNATGPYQFESSPPADIAAMVSPDEQDAADEQPAERITAANAPEIVVSTEPAELIVTEGPAAFVPLVDDLLVLQNSDDDVFMHVGSQEFYIVLAGRWYHASSLNGPWAYQLADKLPKAFANIPQDSNQADSRVYVAGTEEAREAVLDAQVPQTAAVKRGEVEIDVNYDGQPVYEPVDGTNMVYIQNTGSTVLRSGGLYYLVENGVWYVSSSSNGPWQVADHRPAQVDTILPTSPVYNVRYVQVYDSTPELVYVGYTPGYTGSYVYYNTIFYGTGWYYRPWVSPYYYYPRFSTWGFNASYNSWYGWNFGLAWGWGPFSVAYYSGGYWHDNHYWHHNHYSHWGPRGYRPRPVHHGYRNDRYARNGDRHGGSGRNDDRGTGRGDYDRNDRGGHGSNTNRRNDNLYRDGSQRARVADTRDNQPRSQDRRNSSTRQANYASAEGTRQRNDSGLKKGERNRAGPVSTSDLRSKANVRDANIESRRDMLIADNSGNVYRKADRGSGRSDSNERSGGPAGSTKTRTTSSASYGKQNSSQNSSRTSNRASGKSGTKQATQPATRNPSTGNSSRQSQIRVEENRPGQGSVSAANSASRQTQPKTKTGGYNAGKQSPDVAKAPAQKQAVPGANPKQQSSRNNGRSSSAPAQNSRNSSRNYTAPAQSPRNSPANKPAPAKSSQNTGRSSPAPAPAQTRGAPKKSAQHSGAKQGGSKNNGGNRTGGDRTTGNRSRNS